ncbi:MAG: hypothetical protein JF584_07315 [Acidobacteria bacterium]|nr:hypothetical protein [Acidobacteriota bacterium]
MEHLAFIASVRGNKLDAAVLPAPQQRDVSDHAILVLPWSSLVPWNGNLAERDSAASAPGKVSSTLLVILLSRHPAG